MISESFDMKSPPKHREEFENVCGIILTHRKRVLRTNNNESMAMVWKVGGYVSHKLYESYSSSSFSEHIENIDMSAYGGIVLFETAQKDEDEIVLFEEAQIIELKTTELHSKDLGQLDLYLEALDQEERRSNDNPSIGILLCQVADMEFVCYALNSSMSPTMVALYYGTIASVQCHPTYLG